MRHAAGQGGFVAGAEALAFGVLVFVVGTLVIVNAWAVLDARFAASAGAREAARAVATAPSGPASRPTVIAREAVAAALEVHGLDPRQAEIGIRLIPAHERCGEVVAEVRVPVASTALPLAAPVRTLEATATHAALIEPLRAGLGVAEARCDFWSR